MYEYLPVLIVGSIIGAFSILFIIAYAALKKQKEDDGELEGGVNPSVIQEKQ